MVDNVAIYLFLFPEKNRWTKRLIATKKSCDNGIILGVSQIQRNQGILVVHSSTMGSPDLKVVPDCVEDVMLSFPWRMPETNNNMKRNIRNIVLVKTQ